MSQKRTYLGLALATILPLIFVVVQTVHRHHHGGGTDGYFAAQITQSGLATPMLMLLFLSMFMLPLVASLVAGDIVADEDGNGTLKTILTRSVDRGQVFAAKALAAMTYAASGGLPDGTVATVAGVASWGFHPVRPSRGPSSRPRRRSCWCSRPTPALPDPPVRRSWRSACCSRPSPATAPARSSATIGIILLLYDPRRDPRP